MKTILYILLFHISAISFAQDPQLFENTWYLHKINIDNVDYFLPKLEPIGFDEHVFAENPYKFYTGYCDSVDPLVTFDNQNNTFYLEDSPLIVLGTFCTFPQNYTFNNQYFSILYEIDQVAKNPFSYIITIDGNSRFLEITNLEGNKAYYGVEPLSKPDFESSSFSMYPNPAKNELLLSSKTETNNLKIKIFNIEGKLLGTQNLDFKNQVSIDVSNLSSGIYFLNIEDERGNTTIKKFIKQ